MLQIRPKQWQVLGEYMLEQFKMEMLQQFRLQYPDQTKEMGEAQVRQLIDHGILRAEGYGIVNENDVAHYLRCMMRHGQDFDVATRLAWAGRILRNERLNGTQKIRQIIEYELFALRT